MFPAPRCLCIGFWTVILRTLWFSDSLVWSPVLASSPHTDAPHYGHNINAIGTGEASTPSLLPSPPSISSTACFTFVLHSLASAYHRHVALPSSSPSSSCAQRMVPTRVGWRTLQRAPGPLDDAFASATARLPPPTSLHHRRLRAGAHAH